jgi:hypothetical protein
VVFTTLLVLGLPCPAVSQEGPPDGPPPTSEGTAVLTRGPLQVDTVPILCHDADRPDLGFVTDAGDDEWAPEIELSLWPTPNAADSLSMRFDDGDSIYDRTFPLGTPMTGAFVASVNIVSWDPGPGVDLYFSADCSGRLERGG